MTTISGRRSAWRRLTLWYGEFLSWLVAISTAILVVPVTLQVFSRFTSIIPHYIWTEEMARFLLVWTVMIGAMIGVRESTHFEVDVWPRLSRRAEAAIRIVARIGILVIALVFVWSGI
jgi:TRAP-type C4-dicarboxylate transport system permease small subunit